MKAWSFLLGGSQLTGWRSDAEIWASDQHIEVPIVIGFFLFSLLVLLLLLLLLVIVIVVVAVFFFDLLWLLFSGP